MVQLVLCDAAAAAAIFGFALSWARPNKKIKKSNQKQAAAVNASACGFLFGIYFKYLADKLFMDRVFAIPFFSVGFVQLFKVKVACV